jgi:uncharacterized membrane protein
MPDIKQCYYCGKTFIDNDAPRVKPRSWMDPAQAVCSIKCKRDYESTSHDNSSLVDDYEYQPVSGGFFSFIKSCFLKFIFWSVVLAIVFIIILVLVGN